MTESSDRAPVTDLRRSYERARNLTLPEQIEECVDLLGHPDILVTEVLEAFRFVDEWAETAALPAPVETEEFGVIDLDDLANEIFYSTREIAVLNEPCGFTSFASDVDPLLELRATASTTWASPATPVGRRSWGSSSPTGTPPPIRSCCAAWPA
jgi:hypothetical protein